MFAPTSGTNQHQPEHGNDSFVNSDFVGTNTNVFHKKILILWF